VGWGRFGMGVGVCLGCGVGGGRRGRWGGGGGGWYLSGVVREWTGVYGVELGSPWAASWAWGSPVASAAPGGFGLNFLGDGDFEREGDL
jgi:hypothetical protein